jgi:hypothetical protein
MGHLLVDKPGEEQSARAGQLASDAAAGLSEKN